MRFVQRWMVTLAASMALVGMAVAAPCTGEWAAAGQGFDDASAEAGAIRAPDGRSRLQLLPAEDQVRFVGPDGRAQRLLVYAEEGRGLIDPSEGLSEILWLPDGRRFAVSASDGGVVGNFGITVFDVRAGRAQRLPFYRELQVAANRLLRCEEPESANLGLAGWLRGGEEMLVVAEVPPHSVCRNMGALHGFRVATGSGRVLESLAYASMRRRWPGLLGCRAQPAP